MYEKNTGNCVFLMLYGHKEAKLSQNLTESDDNRIWSAFHEHKVMLKHSA